jgi:hypothetical protein
MMQMLVKDEANFGQENHQNIPAFGNFLRSMMHKYPQSYQEKDAAGATYAEHLYKKVIFMQTALRYESVSYSIFLSMVELLGVSDA